MYYYLIAGEASGDLHAASLMRQLKEVDPDARFRFIGGDMMAHEGGEMVRHYRTLAYMGFIPVLFHLRTIMAGMRQCKADIEAERPDAVVLVDYPGFNLSVARHVASRTAIPVAYYIPPKIWAWKEHRIRSIRRYVTRVFSILPFEVEWYAARGYRLDYVGNPTREEVEAFRAGYAETEAEFKRRNGLDAHKPMIAILAGSRRQEIGDNLSRMLAAASQFPDYQAVVAGAPGLAPAIYEDKLRGTGARIVFGETYQLLAHARFALVTSGTATLETAVFGVPQVVCYYLKAGWLMRLLKRLFIKVRHVSLVNLIAGREVVPELIADRANPARIADELRRLIVDDGHRRRMLDGYGEVMRRLGTDSAAATAARGIAGMASRKGEG